MCCVFFPFILFFFLFFSFISLIADGPHHYHPACGHIGSSHLSPVYALLFFYRDASSALLQLVNQWLNFTYSRSHAFRYEEHKSYFGKNRTHDFRTSRRAAYLLDHWGDERLWTSSSLDVPAGFTQEEGHTGFLIHLSAVRALIFLARRIQPFLSLVDREVEF